MGATPTPSRPIRLELPPLPPVDRTPETAAGSWPGMPAPIDPRRLQRRLFGVVAIVCALGLAIEIAFAANSQSELVETLTAMLSLSGEGNVPTWVSTALLFSCALAAGSIARGVPAPHLHVMADPAHAAMARTVAGMLHRGHAIRRGWWGVCAVFAYASLDEAAQLHEHLGGHLETSGIFYYDWVIPAIAIVVVVTVAFWPFVRALPRATRKRLIVAAAIYLGGALAMELPLGWWTDRFGVEGFGYSMIDWVEETLEMIGASLALVALVAHRNEAASA